MSSASGIIEAKLEEVRPTSFSGIRNFFIALITLALIIMLIATPFWTFILMGVWTFFRPTLEHLWVRILSTIILALIGGAIYIFRSKLPGWYGFAEICIGLAVCWAIITAPPNSGLDASVKLAAGVYIIVRGLGNIFNKKAAKP